MSEEVWRSVRVLVTGGFGFVASHLIERLLAAGAECVAIAVERPAESYLALAGLESRVSIVYGDIADPTIVARALSDHEIQVVFHLAARAIVGTAARTPFATFETNVKGTYVLLEQCRCVWEQKTRHLQAVVVASSDKAYGEQAELPYTEEQPLNGLGPYDASKACTDILTRCYARTYGLPAAVTRCANLYGPGDLNFSRMVPSVMRDLALGRRPIIRSDGSPVRDYLYIADAVDGYLRLAEALLQGRALGEAINFGTGEPVSVLQITQEMTRIAGRPDLEPDIRGEAAGEISRQYIDATKARELLGWTATTTREEGLRAAWGFYKDYFSGRGRGA